MHWERVARCDPRARRLADRHYPRRAVGSKQFIAPGLPLVLVTPGDDAAWVTLRQRPEFVDHDWPRALNNVLFRNEGPHRSSDLIRQAVAATRAMLGEPPAEGIITMVDPAKLPRGSNPGWCYLQAGFRKVGHTRSGKRVLQLAAADWPPPTLPLGELLLDAPYREAA